MKSQLSKICLYLGTKRTHLAVPKIHIDDDVNFLCRFIYPDVNYFAFQRTKLNKSFINK